MFLIFALRIVMNAFYDALESVDRLQHVKSFPFF